MSKQYITILIISLLASSCQDFLKPDLDNAFSEDKLLENPTLAEGVLLKAYKGLPDNIFDQLDLAVASDEATSNDPGSTIVQMATGAWQAADNPIGKWEASYQNIQYLNLFLEIVDRVEWDLTSADLDQLHRFRLTGEAYGLRAWYEFQLLQNHTGPGADGNLLGFPIVTQTLTVDDELFLPRNTFQECVDQIMADCDRAMANLVAFYENASGADETVSFMGENYSTTEFDQAMGARWRNRFNGSAARALKARVALYAASPAYNRGSDIDWAAAAEIAGQFLQDAGGLNRLANDGLTFYQNNSSEDIIWNNSQANQLNWEEQNFPPSLFGQGRTNPSQNLVDAFPTANGYPIDHPAGGYTETEPYTERDPRLAQYIVLNNSALKNATISTHQEAEPDGINVQNSSTRTGYYLRKFMDEGVNLATGSRVQTKHSHTHLRFTEVFLNYAEAANEAWGPDGDPLGLGFTAREVISAIRGRSGIAQPDDYIGTLNSTEEWRNLIRNERRLELSFEGHRFWDLRRWEETALMQTPIRGIFIAPDQNSYTVRDIEPRRYENYMLYGPIPFAETLKYNIQQNQGW